jgi:hypothetical protein
MRQATKKQRIALAISVAWILIVFAFANDRQGFIVPFSTLIGILPVLIGWAVWWIRRARL